MSNKINCHLLRGFSIRGEVCIENTEKRNSRVFWRWIIVTHEKFVGSDIEKFSEVSEGHGSIGSNSKIAETMGRCCLRTVPGMKFDQLRSIFVYRSVWLIYLGKRIISTLRKSWYRTSWEALASRPPTVYWMPNCKASTIWLTGKFLNVATPCVLTRICPNLCFLPRCVE